MNMADIVKEKVMVLMSDRENANTGKTPPRKKKQFIDRKTATDFRLLVRSQQDKFADDPSAPQHVLQDISRRKQQQKFGIYFEDDYDYMQHLRPCANAPEEEEVDEDKDEVDIEGVRKSEGSEDGNLSFDNEPDEEEENEEMEEDALPSQAMHVKKNVNFDLQLPEELMGFDDTVFEGRVIEHVDELDSDLLEAMDRAEEAAGLRLSDMEEGEDENDDALEDDFVCLAAGAGNENSQEPGPTGPLLDHFFDTLGGASGLRLAMYGDDDESEETGDAAEQLRAERMKAEREGRAPEDYHSQCLQLQIEKIVEAAVTYDIDEVRSHLSGVSVPLSESMRQAMATDERHRQQSVIFKPEETMTEAERDEHIAKTLAMISEEEEDSDDEEDDPVQAWVDFDRRCKITSNVEAPRDGYVTMSSAVGCTVRLPGASQSSTTSRAPSILSREESLETQASENIQDEFVSRPCLERKKNESSEEKKARKAAVRAAQRERRVVKKQNRLAFKTESSRQAAAKKPDLLVRV